ncbi:MAG: HAMP domain-containing protein [Elainella sp. C42_A2020_010]|nr:HAMP domain-containing protein [Elainella sp. C42_A2020_010]
MRLRSFRLRIALLSAILAGTALVSFGLVAWRLIYAAKVNRLDARLESQVIRATRPRLQGRWGSFIASLPSELGADTDTPIALLVLDQQGRRLYQSDNWTDDFNINLLLPSYSPFFSAVQFNSPGHLSYDSEKVSSPQPNRKLDTSPSADRLPDGTLPDPQVMTQRTATGSWRVAAVDFPPAQAVLAINLQAIDQEMAAIRNIFVLVISGILLLIAGGAWGLSGNALHPIRKLTSAIQQVTVTGLDQRVPIGTGDLEFVELIQVFNQMLERLSRSFKQASRFSADAAHELKTPLAILQGELEHTLQHTEPGSPMQQSLSTLLDEVSRLNSIVRKLLLLSLADAGQISLHKVEVNLSTLLTVIVEDIELSAPHLEVQTHLPADLAVWGDLDLLTQLLQNLISNAIKYNLANGWIRIAGHQQGTNVQITITNASKPIPLPDRERIFDRFYRGDPARTRKVEGIGLGLSLSREIARAHSGDLTLDPTPPGQTSFTLVLPGQVEASDTITPSKNL